MTIAQRGNLSTLILKKKDIKTFSQYINTYEISFE